MTVGPSHDYTFLSRFDAAASHAIQWAVLLVVFDGDAAAWASYLAHEGSPAQRTGDLPFALALARRCMRDEQLRLRLRALALELQAQAH